MTEYEVNGRLTLPAILHSHKPIDLVVIMLGTNDCKVHFGLVPALVAKGLWGEAFWAGFFVPGAVRYIYVLHCTWLVNSAAHMWGERPYDPKSNPAENPLVAIASPTMDGAVRRVAEGSPAPLRGRWAKHAGQVISGSAGPATALAVAFRVGGAGAVDAVAVEARQRARLFSGAVCAT